MVMYSRAPWCSTTVSWMTSRLVKPASGQLDAIFLLDRGALPVVGEGGGAHRTERRDARALDRAHHALAVRHIHRGVDGDADQADADDAGKARARQPFEPVARAIRIGLAEIDLRQLALQLRCVGEINSGKPAALARDKGLTRLTRRSSPAAQKQSAIPPSDGRRPHAPMACFPQVQADNTDAGFAVPQRGRLPMGLVFGSARSISAFGRYHRRVGSDRRNILVPQVPFGGS